MTLRKLISFGALVLVATPSLAVLDEGFTLQPEPAVKTKTEMHLEPPPPVEQDSTLATLEEWARDYELSAGVFAVYYDYKETVPSPLKSTETGTLVGFNLGITRWVRDTTQRFHFDISLARGYTTYDGTTQTGVPVLGTTLNQFRDYNFQYAFGIWSIHDHHQLNIITGLNRRLWIRAGQYTEDYDWWEIPLGISYEACFGENFSMELQHQLNIQIADRIKVYFSEFSSNLRDSEGLIANSLGMKFSAKLTFLRKYFFPVHITPWVEYVHLGQGPEFPIKSTDGLSQGTAYEPASNAWRLGIMAGTAFSF